MQLNCLRPSGWRDVELEMYSILTWYEFEVNFLLCLIRYSIDTVVDNRIM